MLHFRLLWNEYDETWPMKVEDIRNAWKERNI